MSQIKTEESSTTRERLESGCRMLEQILRRRLLDNSPGVGWAIERAIVDRELRDLEEDLRLNPA